ncbi:MAG: precorrin-8X methylmutase [Oscillospiraceae bacterium]|nr:precorrin-8X methylmutase [Oscillospiraceae bacterium]
MNCDFKILKPADIEKRSFEIIEEHIKGRDIPPEQKPILKRVIHTSADFDYADNLVFSKNAVAIGKAALQGGADIITDTNMALSGINKRLLTSFGGCARCFMSDEDIAEEATKRGITRAMVSMEKACGAENDVIIAVGNAPTALIRLYELIMDKKITPKLIIGVPVGFVNVVEAKELIMQSEIPYIVAKGNKGGSGIAAAICNALLLEAR